MVVEVAKHNQLHHEKEEPAYGIVFWVFNRSQELGHLSRSLVVLVVHTQYLSIPYIESANVNPLVRLKKTSLSTIKPSKIW